MKNIYTLFTLIFIISKTCLAQTWNVPSNGSAVGTNSYFGTTTGTDGQGDLVFKVYGKERARFIGSAFIFGNGAATPLALQHWEADFELTNPTNPMLYISGQTAPNRAVLGLGVSTAPGRYSSIALSNDAVISTKFTANNLILGSNAGIKFTTSVNAVDVERLSITNEGLIGINTGSAFPTGAQLFTVSGGDLTIIETADYSKMPDGNGADIYLKDKRGGVLDVFQNENIGAIDVGGTSTEVRMGTSYRPNTATTIFKDGKVAIGGLSNGTHMKRPDGYRLYVKDGILTEKIKIALSSDSLKWSDFVFDKKYKLMPLTEVEKFVDKNKHLPEIPSAEEVYRDGLDVAQMNAKLLQKIEELTLYMIEIKKENEVLKKRVVRLEER